MKLHADMEPGFVKGQRVNKPQSATKRSPRRRSRGATSRKIQLGRLP
jgi:hypothetical protein